MTRMRNKEMEFIWKPDYETPGSLNNKTSMGSKHSIFVHLMHELYGGPCGIDMYLGYSDKQTSKYHFQARAQQF